MSNTAANICLCANCLDIVNGVRLSKNIGPSEFADILGPKPVQLLFTDARVWNTQSQISTKRPNNVITAAVDTRWRPPHFCERCRHPALLQSNVWRL